MTEPVAYLVNGVAFNDNNRANLYADILKYHKQITPDNLVPIPLYTAEQLHPRVKMTQKQYDRLMWDKENADLFQCIDYFNEHDGNSKFGVLTENLRGDLTQEDIARAWLNPEEAIEIVADMKWFVRSKTKENGHYQVLAESRESLMPRYTIFKSYAMTFDTKEQAELWTNPLTEAVLLPVEGK